MASRGISKAASNMAVRNPVPHSSLDNTLGGIGDLADRDGDLQDICFRIFDRGGEGFLVRTEVDDGLDP